MGRRGRKTKRERDKQRQDEMDDKRARGGDVAGGGLETGLITIANIFETLPNGITTTANAHPTGKYTPVTSPPCAWLHASDNPLNHVSAPM